MGIERKKKEEKCVVVKKKNSIQKVMEKCPELNWENGMSKEVS